MRTDPQVLWEQVQENRRRLDGCALHNFTETEVKLGQRLICKKCGGEMSLVDIGNYIRGYKASGKPISDIWPAFKLG